jgi:thiol-disulfide isomerase/thioredoxin
MSSSLIDFLMIRVRPILPTLIGLVVFVLVAWGLYTLYVKSAQETNNDLANVSNASPNGKTLVIYMFHVDWCPHCKKALPEWNQFVEEYDKKIIGGYTVECKDVDCTDNKSPTIKALLDEYKVEQFPTIKGVVPGGPDGKNTVVDFDAKVKKSNLEQFVISISQN